MWPLGLTSSESYPERPGVPNCVYYMRTGFCGYGGRCRYNHPRDRAAVVAAIRATGDYPERVGKPVCQVCIYLQTGTCKFGASCKFHHPKHGAGSLNRAPLNIYGYPLRSPAGTTIPASAPQFYPSVQSPVPLAEQYGGAPLSPVPSPGAQPTVGATSLYRVTRTCKPLYLHTLFFFPERPGELECQYYLKTGDCKYGPSCRYHHPRDQTVPRITCLLSPIGLPLRPVCKVVLYYF
ncbi:unnamed protein product [Malus baccata var. baccata]